ncbi:MAG: TolC family protein [Prevotella sp.]|nr:TolC family protein [Prevotella sp.]
MRKIGIWIALLPVVIHAQTIQQCQDAAHSNYPLINQYGLIEKTTDATVANIQKGWLPQVSSYAQATYQSDVTSWPDNMQSMFQTMGVQMEGLHKDQYRVGIDVNQTVFDGGAISSQKEVAKRQGEVMTAQNEVTLYQIRKRVNEMFFSLLLVDEQLRLSADLLTMLKTNENKLQSMFKHGTAAESDYYAVKAERLNAEQQLTTLKAQRQTLQRMLSAFCGIEITDHPVKPQPLADFPNGKTVARRPELSLIDSQLRLTDAQEKSLNAALMPKLSLFAQGFYGYPGYNMFDDMRRYQWSWNGIVGARMTWNIGALYSHKGDKEKIGAQRSMYQLQREAFLFNNQLEQIQQNEDVVRYRKLMADDEEIIALRTSIRKAAESKLQHGIIDVNELVKQINNENTAKVQHSIHEIEMLKSLYDLKYTLNE